MNRVNGIKHKTLIIAKFISFDFVKFDVPVLESKQRFRMVICFDLRFFFLFTIWKEKEFIWPVTRPFRIFLLIKNHILTDVCRLLVHIFNKNYESTVVIDVNSLQIFAIWFSIATISILSSHKAKRIRFLLIHNEKNKWVAKSIRLPMTV